MVSEHGPTALKVLELMLEARDRKDTVELAVASLQVCIQRGERAKLPSTIKSMIWSTFSPLSCLGKYVDKPTIPCRVTLSELQKNACCMILYERICH